MAEASTELLTTADGRPLKEALAIAQSRAKRRAFMLVLPLLLFVLLTFLIPIGYMLKRSVEHDGFAKSAPALVEWFSANSGFDYANPPEEAYAALVKDLALMQTEKLTGISGTRINYTVPGTISLFKAGARAAADMTPPYKEAMLALNPQTALDDICPQPPLVSQHQPSPQRFDTLAPRYLRFIALYQRLADLF